MRIAQIAPLWESVPPMTYGGIELVVSLLTEALVAQGHEVTLFASGDSKTKAVLEAGTERALRLSQGDAPLDIKVAGVIAAELAMLENAFCRAEKFDVIHNHVGAHTLPLAALTKTPVVTTIHNAHQPPDVRRLFTINSQAHFIAISHQQRRLWPELQFAATIYHGIDLSRFRPDFTNKDDSYLAFLGRMCPEKGPHLAIQLAQETGKQLIMAGKIDDAQRDFFYEHLEPNIDGHQIQFIGEVNLQEKVRLLAGALAMVFPIQWPEPFGLVMAESLACGTPVLAIRNGSVAEIIEDGMTGIIADSIDELIERFSQVHWLSRKTCRQVAERRFCVDRMVKEHIRVYRSLLSGSQEPSESTASVS